MKISLTISMIISITALFLAGFVFADQDFTEAQKLVESEIRCSDLSAEQLEQIGDYYMEQMHPGEAHGMMDKMMGGEGSVQLKQIHISMAKTLYCGEDYSVNSFGGMMGSGMIGSGGMMGMMNMMGGGNMMGYGGMMGLGNYGWGWSLFGIINYLLIAALIIAAIYWLIKNAEKKK